MMSMNPHLRRAAIRAGTVAAAVAVAAGAVPAGGVLAGASDGNSAEPAVVTECTLIAADVDRETVTFTVGPEGCTDEVGPISFSAFLLPSGMREPYEDQVLIAHHESNGAFYGAGSFQLTVDMGTPCNWQTDLYFGIDLMPKFQYLIAYDYDEREVCVEETASTSTSTSTSSTSSTSTSTTSTTSTSTTTVVDSAGGGATTTTTMAGAVRAVPETTTTSVASAGPVPTPAGGGTLPATGPAETSILALLAGILVATGLLVRRVARA